VLDGCITHGSDMELPFACPADWLLNIKGLDAAALPYRVSGFLSVYEQVRGGGLRGLTLTVDAISLSNGSSYFW